VVRKGEKYTTRSQCAIPSYIYHNELPNSLCMCRPVVLSNEKEVTVVSGSTWFCAADQVIRAGGLGLCRKTSKLGVYMGLRRRR
jgi:hypothetical protein